MPRKSATEKTRAGSTLVELLVSVALSSLVAIMIAGLYLFSNKLVLGFQAKTYLNDQRLLLETALSEKLKFLEEIRAAGDDGLVFSTLDGATCDIAASAHAGLLLDGRALLPDGFVLEDFRLRYFALGPGADGEMLVEAPDENGNFSLDGEELEGVLLLEISFTLGHKKTIAQSRRLYYLKPTFRKEAQ